jgi:hypothetical protein
LIIVYAKAVTIPDHTYKTWLFAAADNPNINATAREPHRGQQMIVDAWNRHHLDARTITMPLDSDQFEYEAAPDTFTFPNE